MLHRLYQLEWKPHPFRLQHHFISQPGLTLLISVQRSDGVFLLETDWLFEGL
jgi:hypothetical protein